MNVPDIIYDWWKTLENSERLKVLRATSSQKGRHFCQALALLESRLLTEVFIPKNPVKFKNATIDSFLKYKSRRELHAIAALLCQLKPDVERGENNQHPARALAKVPVETSSNNFMIKLESSGASASKIQIHMARWLRRVGSAKFVTMDVKTLTYDLYYWDASKAYQWASFYQSGTST